MRVLGPTPGMLHDRLTVLDLKIHFHAKQARSTQVFVEEKEEIVEYIHSHWPNHARMDCFDNFDPEILRGLVDELNGVNKRVWVLIDEVRALPETAIERLAQLCKLIPDLNDKRAALVSQIDEVYGYQKSFEKIYTQPAHNGNGFAQLLPDRPAWRK